MGKPVLWKLFTAQDLFLIPFSVLWCLITVPFLYGALTSGNFFLLFMPHAWVGLYMLFGRFIYKIIRKRHTYYAVTNQRVLVLINLFGRKFQAISMDRLPATEKTEGFGGIGTITFVGIDNKSWSTRKRKSHAVTGLEGFTGVQTFIGFYDIRNVGDVYRLISELSTGASQMRYVASKPLFLPR